MSLIVRLVSNWPLRSCCEYVSTSFRGVETVPCLGHLKSGQGQRRNDKIPLSCHSIEKGQQGAPWEVQAAQEELLKQQSMPAAPTYDLDATRVLVETAMFAAVGGLAFSIAAVLKLQGYLGYLLPMPIVLSAMRSGPAVGRKATVATATLLLVLLGPLQAVSYLLQHGISAWALGSLWALQSPWWLSILVASVIRMAGVIGFLAFTSWTLNENLYRLLVTQIYALLDQMGSLIGASGTPSPLVIQVVMVSVLLVNCLMYVSLLHVLYAILLRSMGYRAMQMPAFLERRLLPAQFHARQAQ